MFNFLSKFFYLRSKYLMILLIVILIGIVAFSCYLKWYVVDVQNEQLDHLVTKNDHLKQQISTLQGQYHLINDNVTLLQTQMTHGVIVDPGLKGRLKIKDNVDVESTFSSHVPADFNDDQIDDEVEQIINDIVSDHSDYN